MRISKRFESPKKVAHPDSVARSTLTLSARAIPLDIPTPTGCSVRDGVLEHAVVSRCAEHAQTAGSDAGRKLRHDAPRLSARQRRSASLSAVVARRRGAYRDSSPSPSPVAFAEGSRGGRSCAIPSTSQPTLRASSCDTLYTNIWSDTLSVIADGGRCRPPATSHLWRREKVRPLCFEVGPCKVRDRQ